MTLRQTSLIVRLARRGFLIGGAERSTIIIRDAGQVVFGLMLLIVMGSCWFGLAFLGSLLLGSSTIALLGTVGLLDSATPLAHHGLLLGIAMVAAVWAIRRTLATITVAP